MTYAMLLTDVHNTVQATLPDNYDTIVRQANERGLFKYIGQLVRQARHHFHH